MKKYFLFLLCAVFAGGVFSASEGSSESAKSPVKNDGLQSGSGKFEPSVYVSLQDPNMQWWFNLPEGFSPHISQARRIFIGETFSLFSFFNEADVKDGNFDITYSITLESPAGEKAIILAPTNFKGEKKSKDIIIAAPDVLTSTFAKSYKVGRYFFELSATDNVSGARASVRNYADFMDWTAPAPFEGAKLVFDYIRGFYLQPSPETLYSIFFSKDFNLEQKGAPNSLNYTYIGFLRAAFKNNLFLVREIRKNFASYDYLDRAKIIFLMAIIGESKFDDGILSAKEKDYQQRIYAAEFPDPYGEWNRVLGAAQMDMLFGEFYATGAYTPIRRVMDLLAYADEAAFAEKAIAEKKRPESSADRDKFLLGVLNRTALFSLIRRAEKDPLIEAYCIWAARNNDLPERALAEFKPLFEESGDTPTDAKKSDNAASSPSKIVLPEIKLD